MDHLGEISTHIDDGIEAPVTNDGQFAFSITQDVFGLGVKARSRLSAVKQGDFVTVSKGRFGDVAANKLGTAEDEEFHGRLIEYAPPVR